MNTKNPKRFRIAPVLALALAATAAGEEGKCLKAALGAARWIGASATAVPGVPGAKAWPADPADPASVNTTLYAGTPGVVLFYLEAWNAVKDKAFLDEARAGAAGLLAGMNDVETMGLYEGLSGVGFALEETFKAAGEERFRRGFLECLERIGSSAVRKGKGVEWSSVTDVISGSSGIGLFLLYAGRELGDNKWTGLAADAGRRLVELAIPEHGGLKWAMDPAFPRLMPNFAHGTAGNAYFLARLFAATGDGDFLKAALAGGQYLKAVADTDNDGCLVFHDEPDNRGLYYLGWCHGPTGTARLFYELYAATKDAEWLGWTKRSARSILTSGIPAKQAPGLWNNDGLCCGLAGVGDFFLDLYRATKDAAYLEFCCKVTDALLSHAAEDRGGLKWAQAEHRSRPEFVVAQTGLMQGAAGIGLFLLRVDGRERGRARRIVLPDTPFR